MGNPGKTGCSAEEDGNCFYRKHRGYISNPA